MRFSWFVLIFIVLPCFTWASFDPAHNISSVFQNDKQACATCQLAAILINARNASICSSLPGCKSAWQYCEIVQNLPTFNFENPKNDHLDWIFEMVHKSRQNCGKEDAISLAATEPSPGTCMQCILVYELLNFLHDNVIGVATEQAVLNIIAEMCSGLVGIPIRNFCMDSQQILNAIFNGLRDSMGGLYELVGCNLLGCPPLPQFLCSCLGEMCP